MHSSELNLRRIYCVCGFSLICIMRCPNMRSVYFGFERILAEEVNGPGNNQKPITFRADVVFRIRFCRIESHFSTAAWTLRSNARALHLFLSIQYLRFPRHLLFGWSAGLEKDLRSRSRERENLGERASLLQYSLTWHVLWSGSTLSSTRGNAVERQITATRTSWRFL